MHRSRKTNFCRWLLLLAVCVLLDASGLGQTAVQTTGKAWTFDVISIRRGQVGGPQRFGATPDGYQIRNLFFMIPILSAYPRQSGGSGFYGDDQRVGFPDWVNNDIYDIDAKVSAADLADWHDPAKQPVMLQSMLQAMLADRLKLVVHRSSKEGKVYEMAVAKNGPKFKATDPAEHHTGQFKLPDGAVVVTEVTDCMVTTHYYGITMPTVASLLLSAADRPVVDKTGLTGRYDITMTWQRPVCAPHQEGTPPDTGQSVFSKADEMGLKLVPAPGQIETLVIDHIEKPSEN